VRAKEWPKCFSGFTRSQFELPSAASSHSQELPPYFEWRKQVGANMPLPNSEAGAEGTVKKAKKKKAK
jgi:hypothetical protein